MTTLLLYITINNWYKNYILFASQKRGKEKNYAFEEETVILIKEMNK